MLIELSSSILLAAALLVSGGALGWLLGRYPRFPLVVCARWWLGRCVLPMIRRRSWAVRSGFILANNMFILTAILMVGLRTPLAPIVVFLEGASLGTALYLLRDLPQSALPPATDLRAPVTWRFRLGMVLNLLEPPAILLATGLAIGTDVVPLAEAHVWRVFATWVAPAMLVAACGEALWLGERIE